MVASVFVHSSISVSDPSDIGEARRRMGQIAAGTALNETERGNAAIVVTELATNLVRYAKGGEILLLSSAGPAGDYVEVLALDRGPGISDLGRCLEDGFSTGGTPGNGLGAVQRLATEFDIFSEQPSGTIVFARLGVKLDVGSPNAHFKWAVVSRPAPNEEVCGDRWRITERPGMLALMIVDGLGHGLQAAEAADQASRAFDRDPFLPLAKFIENADTLMRGTRGGAVAAARIDAQSGEVHYIGVGNIAGNLSSCVDLSGRGLFSHNGTVGVQMRNVKEFVYPCPPDGLLIMHSDGLQTRWSLEAYPGLIKRHPALIAAALFRDFTRGRDDVTVAAVRISL